MTARGPVVIRQWAPLINLIAWLYAATFVGLVFYLLRSTRRGLLAAVTPDGIVLQLARSGPSFIPIEDVSRADYIGLIHSKHGGVALFLRSEARTLDICGVFNFKREALDFADRVNTYIADATPEATTPAD